MSPQLQIQKEPLRLRPDQPQQWTTFGNSPIPLEDACRRVLEAHTKDGSRDDEHMVAYKAWTVAPVDGFMTLRPVPVDGARERGPYFLREHGFRQLCQRIGAPTDYIRGLPAKLQLALLNYGLIHNGDTSGMMRLAGNEVRAMVSDRYATFDDRIVLDVVCEVFDKAGLLKASKVRSLATGATTVLRVTFPTESAVVRDDDVFEYGLDITNGEIGNRAIGLTSLSYRLICKNGMRGWRTEANTRLRHVGDASKLHDAFRDAVPVVLAEARGQFKQWEMAVDHMVDDVLAEVDMLRQWGPGVGDVREIGKTIADEKRIYLPPNSSAVEFEEVISGLGGVDVYSVANAITLTAQRKDDVDQRLEMEEIAHRYLSHRVGPVVPVED